MHNALTRFKQGMSYARDMNSLFHVLKLNIGESLESDHLLRSQIVYSISAFDKLLRDLIRIGMVDSYRGVRKTTPMFLSETISIETHHRLQAASIAPRELLFEQEVYQKHKLYTYQDPKKVADGLSYIWNESHKWAKVASEMRLEEEAVKTQLKLIVSRRNSIVHESDLDPISHQITPINYSEAQLATDFLEACGKAIFSLVSSKVLDVP